MVGRPFDCLANPLGAVRFTFEMAVALGSDPASLDGKDWGATHLFSGFLSDKDNLSKIPPLNSVNAKWLQPNSLVRFRGMIQDMLGNEFYVGAYKDGDTWNTNKYTDVSEIPMVSSPDTRVWERRLLYCVLVPGQNAWTETGSDGVKNRFMSSTSPNREKRQRDDSSVFGDVDMRDSDSEVPNTSRAKKMREDGYPQCANEGACSASCLSPDFDGNYFPCLVKIYDSPESELKLNEICEFIGVLTFDPELKGDKDDSDELANSLLEDELIHLPPSKVPRLHCLVHRKLSVADFLFNMPTSEPKFDLVKGIRETLLHHLTVVLGGDGLAAHFMLLHFLSMVHARVDSLAIGKLSLNLTGFSKETISVFGNRIKGAIKNLLPFTHSIPLTIDYLNSVSLVPTKDYQTNRLLRGVLQLAKGSHVIIDETPLQSGTLNSTGIENARLLKDLMELQKVEYDFKYYRMKMDADVQLLILSEAKSNILPADLVLPFRPSSVAPLEITDAETLEAWRWYLATLRALPHSIEPEMEKVVEDDLVAARQVDRTLDSEDISRWLTMGRLMSVSFGEKTLSLEHWQMTKELERLREERFPN